MKKRKTYDMVITAIFSAIILLMSLIPQLGYITLMPGVSVTLVHIPVLIGVMLLGFKGSIILGFFFGLGSLFAALMYARTPFDMAFIYPWISVLPRMLFALAAHYIAVSFVKITKLKYGKIALMITVSLVTSVALYFGTNAIVKNATLNDYNKTLSEISVLKKEDEAGNQTLIIELEEKLPGLLEKANNDYQKITTITTPIIIVITILIIVIYVIYIKKQKEEGVAIPSILILSTLIHTALVIGAVALFNPDAFLQTFGGNQSVASILYAIAMANGLIESLVAVFIGTPIFLALKEVKESM